MLCPMSLSARLVAPGTATVGLVLVTLACVGTSAVLLGSSASAAPDEQVVTAARGNLAVTTTAPGTVASRTVGTLAFTTDGTVARVMVGPGSVVSRGDVVASLDDGLARGRVDAARRTLDADTAARASLEAGTVPAAGTPIVAPAPDPMAQSRLDGAVATDEQAVAEAEAGLEATVLRAPQDGTVTAMSAQVGTRVSPADGTAAVGSLADLGALGALVGVGPADIAGLSPGQRASVSVDGVAGPLGATVDSVAPAPGPDGRYAVALGIEAAPATMRLGQTVVAAVTTAEAQRVLLVPRAALRGTGAPGAPVSVLVRRPGGDRTVAVAVGLADLRTVQITRGLTAGDLVVVPGGATEGAAP